MAELPQPGTLVEGRYELTKLLGQGTFGTVWSARDTRLGGRLVALKFLRAEHVEIPEAITRFDAEAEALALLQHPNVVGVLDRGAWENTRYLVTEFVDGTTLAYWIGSKAQGASFPDYDEVFALFDQACAGIEAAHAVRSPGAIVHRDLKPDNILLQRHANGETTVKILDFGIAQLGGRGGTRSGALMGTPLYMAPEQAMGRTDAVGPWTDVFALGVILIEMLTLRPEPDRDHAWWGLSLKHGATLEARIAALRTELPPSLLALLLKTLQSERAERYATAGELRTALRAVRLQLNPSAIVSGPVPALVSQQARAQPGATQPPEAPSTVAEIAPTLAARPGAHSEKTPAPERPKEPPPTPAPPPTRTGRRWGLLAAGIGAFLALGGVGLVVARGRGPHVAAPAPTRAPDAGGTMVTGGRAVSEDPELAEFVTRWNDAIVQRNSALDGFYLPTAHFRSGSALAATRSIRDYWNRIFNNPGASFTVDARRSVFNNDPLEPGSGAAKACTADGRVAPTTTLRLFASENYPGRSEDIGCPHLEGVYLLRVRRTGTGPRICYESWSLREGVCASCPTAPACQPSAGR